MPTQSQVSAPQVFLDRCSPFASTFVEVHFRNITVLQAVDGLGKFLAQTFFLDLPDRIHVGLEGEDQSFRAWQPMESLPLASQVCLGLDGRSVYERVSTTESEVGGNKFVQSCGISRDSNQKTHFISQLTLLASSWPRNSVTSSSKCA